MTRSLRRLATAATLVVAGAGSGCAATDWNDVIYGRPAGHAGEVTGTVSRVDTHSRTIQLREDRGGSVNVRYDGSTRVVYQGRRYTPAALERGDLVTARVRRDRYGDLYTAHVLVRRDARGRSDRDAAVVGRRETLQGRVGRVSRGEGRFELRTGSRIVRVTLPYRPSPSVESRFRRLRTGETVRVEGVWMGQQRFELRRFR
jgi:hypothetical protein